MNRRRGGTVAVAIGAALLLTGATVRAHHSIAGVYDSTQSVTFDAVVAEFHLVNPHAYLIVTVDADGGSERWKLEMDNRYELVDVGVKPDTLRAGDHVVVRGSRARDGSRSLYLMRLDRPADHFWYEQVGSSPHIGRSSPSRR